MGADGAAALAPALVLLAECNQRSIHLANNDIGDAGALSLAPALGRVRPSSLLSLDLSGNGIGDAGVLHVAPALARLTSFCRLWLDRGNDVSAAGVAAFRAGVPACVWEVTDFDGARS